MVKKNIFEKKHAQAAKLSGKIGLFKKIFWRKVLPQAAKLPGTSGVFKTKTFFEKKVLPRAAKLPGTSCLLKKKRKSSAPGNEAARDKWLVQKKQKTEKKTNKNKKKT